MNALLHYSFESVLPELWPRSAPWDPNCNGDKGENWKETVAPLYIGEKRGVWWAHERPSDPLLTIQMISVDWQKYACVFPPPRPHQACLSASNLFHLEDLSRLVKVWVTPSPTYRSSAGLQEHHWDLPQPSGLIRTQVSPTSTWQNLAEFDRVLVSPFYYTKDAREASSDIVGPQLGHIPWTGGFSSLGKIWSHSNICTVTSQGLIHINTHRLLSLGRIQDTPNWTCRKNSGDLPLS